MTESTLSLEFSAYRQGIADYFDYPLESADWNDGQTYRINKIARKALWELYHNNAGYQWRCLEQLLEIVTVASTWAYDLPDEFGNLLSKELAFGSGEATNRVKVRPPEKIYELRQTNTTTGTPQAVAVRSRSFRGTTGERWEAILWPTPNGVFNLYGQCRVNPDRLTTKRPFPRGGLPLAGVLEALCLKHAELDKHEGQGKMAEEADTVLRAAIQRDGESGPKSLGRDPEYGNWREPDATLLARVHSEYLGT